MDVETPQKYLGNAFHRSLIRSMLGLSVCWFSDFPIFLFSVSLFVSFILLTELIEMHERTSTMIRWDLLVFSIASVSTYYYRIVCLVNETTLSSFVMQWLHVDSNNSRMLALWAMKIYVLFHSVFTRYSALPFRLNVCICVNIVRMCLVVAWKSEQC